MTMSQGSKANKYVCPNDRQLSLRAKLRTGWIAAKSEPPLTTSEQEAIVAVIKRAEKLEEIEAKRVGRLVARLEGMRRSAQGPAPKSCLVCGESPRLLAPLKTCSICRNSACPRCVIEFPPNSGGARSPLYVRDQYMCNLCAETREMWKKSGAWFFKSVPKYILPERKIGGRYNEDIAKALQQDGGNSSNDGKTDSEPGSPLSLTAPTLSRQPSNSDSRKSIILSPNVSKLDRAPRIVCEKLGLISVTMDYFCNACLSNGRKLVNVFTLPSSLQDFCRDLQMNEMSYLCWECKAELYRIEHFKQKVKYANDLITRISNVQSSSSKCLSLSRLNVSNHIGFDLEINGTKFKSTNPTIKEEKYIPISLIHNENRTEPKISRSMNVESKEGYDAMIVKVEPEDVCEYLDNNTDSVPASYSANMPLTLTIEPMQKSLENEHEMSQEENDIKCVVVDKINMRCLKEEEMIELREKSRNSVWFKREPYRCTTCVIQFATIETFDEHNRLHSDENGPFKCRICEQTFRTEVSLSTHVHGHYRIYLCARCSYENFRLKLVSLHIRKSHKKTECRRCNLTFNSQEQFKEHNKQHDYTECHYCHKMLKHNFLRKHIINKHEVVNVKCRICNETLGGKDRLYYHMKKKHENQEDKESYYCVECDKQFTTKCSFRNHCRNSARHGSNKYECDHCQKKCPSKGLLIKHIHRMHTENKTFKCTICNKKYGSEYVLKHHVDAAHNAKKKKKHICELCGHAFVHLKSLNDHKNSHSGARPYKCDLCDSTFSYSAALYNHKRIVHYNHKRIVHKKKRVNT